MINFIFLIKLIKNFFILIGMMFVVFCLLMNFYQVYVLWKFNDKTSLRIRGDVFTTSIVVDTNNSTIKVDEIIFPESVCFCRIEHNHIIAISNIKDYKDNTIILTKKLEFGIYDYINKTKLNLNQKDFYFIVRKEFPLTYNALTKYQENQFFCAKQDSSLPFISDTPMDCKQLNN